MYVFYRYNKYTTCILYYIYTHCTYAIYNLSISLSICSVYIYIYIHLLNTMYTHSVVGSSDKHGPDLGFETEGSEKSAAYLPTMLCNLDARSPGIVLGNHKKFMGNLTKSLGNPKKP